MVLEEINLKFLFSGAMSWDENGEGLMPLRFTGEQMAELSKNERFAVRSRASAGICFTTCTDAEKLEMDASMVPGSAIDLYGFDLYVDGQLYAHVEGHLADGAEVSLSFDLPVGEKKIALYFPTLVGTRIKKLSLPGATYAHPAHRDLLFCFGDSITQGYTVHFPSLCYANTLARALDMDLYDFGVGGDTFHPKLIDESLKGQAALILVAYGTNDWSKKTLLEAPADAEAFFKRAADIASGKPVIAVMPIWRADCDKPSPMGIGFDEWRVLLASVAAKYPNVHPIDGNPLFPPITDLFADQKIHPNEAGSAIYAERLLKAIRELSVL